MVVVVVVVVVFAFSEYLETIFRNSEECAAMALEPLVNTREFMI